MKKIAASVLSALVTVSFTAIVFAEEAVPVAAPAGATNQTSVKYGKAKKAKKAKKAATNNQTEEATPVAFTQDTAPADATNQTSVKYGKAKKAKKAKKAAKEVVTSDQTK